MIAPLSWPACRPARTRSTATLQPWFAIKCGASLRNKNAPAGCRGVLRPARGQGGGTLVLLEEAREFLLEARDPAAAVHDLLGAAGPRRVRLRVDVEVQLVTLLAPGRARLVFGAVGHHDRNRMIIRVNFGFHGISLEPAPPV